MLCVWVPLLFVVSYSLSTVPSCPELVNQYRDEYFATINPLQKKALLHDIVHRILERGGRFLKGNENGNGWDEVDTDRAVLKTAHAIQYQRRKSVEHANMQIAAVAAATLNAHTTRRHRRPETPLSSSQSGASAALGSPFSVPQRHLVTPTISRTAPIAISSYKDLFMEPHQQQPPQQAMPLYHRPGDDDVQTARELLWSTPSSSAIVSPRDKWKQQPPPPPPPCAARHPYATISTSSSSPHHQLLRTITLRDAVCFSQPQQSQQQRWYNTAPGLQQRRAVSAESQQQPHLAEPVSSRHHGSWPTTEVVASMSFNSTLPKQLSCFDSPSVICSMDKVLAFDDCSEVEEEDDDDARLCGNPFDEESIPRNDNDDNDESSIGSFDDAGDALDLSLLGALDMNW
jgi:hypothetical protein